MRRHMVVGVISTTLFMSGSSGSDDAGQQSNKTEEATSTQKSTSAQLVPGFRGGCKTGFTVFSQKQFTGDGGGYGALVRDTLDSTGRGAGLLGNDKLTAVGWFTTGELLYPKNPEGIRGETWYFIQHLPNGGSGWVADAGVRAVETVPAPGNGSRYYSPEIEAPPKPHECELSKSD